MYKNSKDKCMTTILGVAWDFVPEFWKLINTHTKRYLLDFDRIHSKIDIQPWLHFVWQQRYASFKCVNQMLSVSHMTYSDVELNHKHAIYVTMATLKIFNPLSLKTTFFDVKL